MRSFGIPVNDSVDELASEEEDFSGDLNQPEPIPPKSLKSFEQVDMDDDDIDTVTRDDPMLSSYGANGSSGSSISSRGSSVESVDELESRPLATKSKIVPKRRKRNSQQPIPEAFRPHRIPVVSRPVRVPVQVGGEATLVFPLPAGLRELEEVMTGRSGLQPARVSLETLVPAGSVIHRVPATEERRVPQRKVILQGRM